MRTLRLFFLASVLILSFTSIASAGEMTTGVAPPSSSSQGEMSTTVDGEMQNGVAGDMHTGSSDAADDSAADVVGLVVDVLSSLF